MYIILKIILKLKKNWWIQTVNDDDLFPSILRVKNLSNLKVTL